MTEETKPWYQLKSTTHLLGALGIIGLDVFGLYLSQMLDNIYLAALVVLNFPIAVIYAVVYFIVLLFDITAGRHTVGESDSAEDDIEHDEIVPDTGHFSVFGFLVFTTGMFLTALASPYIEALLFDNPVYEIETMIGIFFISGLVVGGSIQILLAGLGRTYYRT